MDPYIEKPTKQCRLSPGSQLMTPGEGSWLCRSKVSSGDSGEKVWCTGAGTKGEPTAVSCEVSLQGDSFHIAGNRQTETPAQASTILPESTWPGAVMGMDVLFEFGVQNSKGRNSLQGSRGYLPTVTG